MGLWRLYMENTIKHLKECLMEHWDTLPDDVKLRYVRIMKENLDRKLKETGDLQKALDEMEDIL
jgi:hypothetical protein